MVHMSPHPCGRRPMERMDTLDAEFLHLEDGIAHMHIGAACLFADPPPSFDEIAGMIAAKLHLIPRYRQRVRSVPLELGRPLWVDDPHFNLAYHLRHTALPAPGDDAALCRLIGQIMSQPLDRDRPLWETWLVEGLEGGQWAVLPMAHPADAIRSAVGTARGLARFAGDLGATPPLSIEGSIGPHRAWAQSSSSLGDVRTIRSVFAGTINDVVLAAVSGGYREPLLSRGEDADRALVRSLVPVSTRHDDGHGGTGNRVSALLYDLPVQIADPVERLEVVHEQ